MTLILPDGGVCLRTVVLFPSSSNEVSLSGYIKKKTRTRNTFAIASLPVVLDFDLQTVLCFDRFTGPQWTGLGGEVDVVPLRIKMSQHQFFRSTLVRQP